MFQANAPWYQDVSDAPLDAESATVMAGLQARGGWGGGSMRVDFSIEVLRADASTPMRTFTPNDEFYDPDCDNVPGARPRRRPPRRREPATPAPTTATAT